MKEGVPCGLLEVEIWDSWLLETGPPVLEKSPYFTGLFRHFCASYKLIEGQFLTVWAGRQDASKPSIYQTALGGYYVRHT